ncbi:MAG: hypothetical protein KTR30_01150 [Saprospiraceae bacterium]|nr:hypothetical protein [Saprospiraceae bacterium]
MKKKDLSSLDLPALQKKRDRAARVQKVVLGLIIFYVVFIIYTFVTKEWEASRFGPLVAGLAGLAAATSSLKRQISQVEQEMASRSPVES